MTYGSCMIHGRADNVPRWRGLTHFDNFLSVDFTDGSKWEDLSKVRFHAPILRITDKCCDHQICVPVLRNALGDSEDGFRLLRCTRAYVELDLLASFDVHTDITIEHGRSIATTFCNLASVSYLFCAQKEHSY